MAAKTTPATPISPTVTTSINSLPPECLEPILNSLKTNALALSSLLRVSRLFFTLTVPILYSDPFSICPFENRTQLHKVILDSATENGSFSVAAFLEATRGQCGSLDCHGQCESGAKFQEIMDNEQEEKEKTRGSQEAPAGGVEPSQSIRVIKAKTRTIVRYVDFLTHYNGELWLTYATTCLTKKSQQHLTTKLLIRMHTRIIDHTAERLESMDLLPGTIRDIIPVAHRFRSLVRLQLVGRYNSDELNYFSVFLSARQRNVDIWAGEQESDGDGRDNDASSRTYAGKKSRKRPNVVREIEDFTLPQVLYTYPSHQSVTTREQLVRLVKLQQLNILRSLGNRLLSLNASNCSDFFKIAPQIPCHLLKSLGTFKFVQGSLNGDAEFFLRRCRALTSLDFTTFHRDIFPWAVNEKLQLQLPQQQFEQQQQQPTTATTGASSPTTTAPQPFSAELIQLKHLRLAVSQWLVGRSLHSTLFAFSHSLESFLLNVYNHELLRSENSFVTIGLSPFEGCPMLEDLLVRGRVAFSTASGGIDVLRIPRLRSLDLDTGIAKEFQFESLEFSPRLESLVLADAAAVLTNPPPPPLLVDYDSIFPSVCPTPVLWTWTMNYLTRIHLTGSPAFQFRFEWLQRCPAVTSLVINGLLPSALPQAFVSEHLATNGSEETIAAYGKHLSLCDLVLFHRPQDSITVTHRQALASALETYCHNIDRLKLTTTTSLGRYQPIQTPTPVPAPAPSPLAPQAKDSSVDDIGLALFASRNLQKLKHITTMRHPDTPLATVVQRYGLVRGSLVMIQSPKGGDEGVEVMWCPSIVFKPFQIEILGVLEVEGTTLFQQRASWQFPHTVEHG
ncbi:hypothetical protein BGZ95_002152 [Linnemannia exigua]|uniref:Uncharacterized protein n=1 Tax=Linnemannia exigua TaxID=604196 RepID=A0AAD4H288_9FUNG|nr:hypothetical protein BGZ95_002152 [Linnemannia exigua]